MISKTIPKEEGLGFDPIEAMKKIFGNKSEVVIIYVHQLVNRNLR